MIYLLSVLYQLEYRHSLPLNSLDSVLHYYGVEAMLGRVDPLQVRILGTPRSV